MENLTATKLTTKQLYYIKNKDKIREQQRTNHKLYRDKNRETLNLHVQLYYLQLRLEVFKKLGDKCRLCGFEDKRALQIDHVNGDGCRERKLLKNGRSKYYKKVLEDKSGMYQLLCANCNQIKRKVNNEN